MSGTAADLLILYGMTGEDAREAAIRELIESLPPPELLHRWADENRPPQSWFDDEEIDLLR